MGIPKEIMEFSTATILFALAIFEAWKKIRASAKGKSRNDNPTPIYSIIALFLGAAAMLFSVLTTKVLIALAFLSILTVLSIGVFVIRRSQMVRAEIAALFMLLVSGAVLVLDILAKGRY